MNQFEIAGREIDWPLIAAAGMTNHPSIEGVANRLKELSSTGLSVVTVGSWTLGAARGGNGYEEVAPGSWEHIRNDEYVDLDLGAGYNAKGLPNPGAETGLEHLPDLIDVAQSHGANLAVSLSPHSGQPLEELKELYEVARKALQKGALYVELNLSCPNVPGKPPFFQDLEGVLNFREYANAQPPLRNKEGELALYEKFGPFRGPIDYAYTQNIDHIRGLVVANTVGGQRPTVGLEAKPTIEVNNGQAGMSGPHLEWLGKHELAVWLSRLQGQDKEIISSLGVTTGEDAYTRLIIGAKAVQLASALYWPEFTGNETAQQAVQQIKEEFVTAANGSL